MSDNTHTGPLNPYGDLSRRARRALEAQGINPDEALAQYNETGNMDVLTGAITIIPQAPVKTVVDEVAVEAPEVVAEEELAVVEEDATHDADAPDEPEAPIDEPASSPELFPSIMSRRDENLLEQRATSEIEVIEEVADIEALVAVVETDEAPIDDVVIEAPAVTSQDIEPVPLDGGPLADVEDVIAIDRSDDTESTISEYEAFQITTTSTGVIQTTGHTLVLPTLPEDDPSVIAALNQTGEIVITGQITLPLGIPTSTDPAGLDSIDLDSNAEPELVTSSNDLAPVSAAAAVSSVAGPTNVVSPIKRRSEKLPMILAISAAILAAGVVALFVANLFIPVFK